MISESVGALFKAKRSLETMTPAERTARAKKAAAAAGQCGGAGEEGEETERGHEMTEKDVITQPELALETVPDLPALAAAINAEHAAVGEALKAGLSHAIRAGELLIEAKALAGHGEWLPWLAANCATISERTAQAYMRVARLHPDLLGKSATGVADLSFREAVKLLAEPAETRTVEAPEDFSLSTQFIPAPGHMLVAKQGDWEARIFPYSGDGWAIPAGETYFYVTVISKAAGGGYDVDGFKKPIRQDGIEACLRFLRFPLDGAKWENSEASGADHNFWLSDGRPSAGETVQDSLQTLASATVMDALNLADYIDEHQDRGQILAELLRAQDFIRQIITEAEKKKG